MKNNKSSKGSGDLRKLAEKSLQYEPDRPVCADEAHSLIHELRVHQIELEMQNEELRRAQNDLEISRSRYADLYDFAPVGYLTLNKHGQIVDLNLTAARQLGVERGQLINTHFQNFIFQPDKNEFLSHLQAVFDSRERQISEVRLSPKGGEQFDARLEGIYIEGNDGAGLCRISMSDVTLHKKVEDERLHSEKQSLQVLQAESLSRMAGAIAHHFNNKLMAVMGNLELALHFLPQESTPRTKILQAMKASHQAAEISRLMLACIGQTVEKKEPIYLAETVREPLRQMAISLPQNLHLRTEIPLQGALILADPWHIKQILTYLVLNASEAMGDQEGDILVAICDISSPQFKESKVFPPGWKSEAGSYACLSVSDVGNGIDTAIQEKIFDPFFSTKGTGRGLGLSVVLGLVGAYEGAVVVESQRGRGATFQVFFPLLAAKKPPAQYDGSLVSDEIETGLLVLLVDDEPMIRDIGKDILKMLGCEVIAAADGSEAVEIFSARKNEISLVLLDLNMPGMNGPETLRGLRNMRPDVPVILTSGYDEAQVMRESSPERPQAFLHKPYSKDDLKAAIVAAQKT